jgi:hypothetical protein
MMTGVSALIWTPVYAILIVSLLFWTSYHVIVRVFKWLTLVLFSYLIAAFLAHPIGKRFCIRRSSLTLNGRVSIWQRS